MEGIEDLEALVAFGVVFSLFAFVIMVVLYILGAIARFKYLRVRGYENSWLAFIPVINVYGLVEATYGKGEKIRIYGWDAPAIVLKIWPIINFILSFFLSPIPYIGGVIGLVLTILNIMFLVLIFRDSMERLNKQVSSGLAVLAILITLVQNIMLLCEASKYEAGSLNYIYDNRILISQSTEGGVFSFLNGSK